MKKYISIELEFVKLMEEDIVTASTPLFSDRMDGDTDFGDQGSF